MKIKDLLKKELMIMDLKASTKMEAIDEMVAKLKEKNIISDEVVFKDLILKREEKSSTGLGEGIAMPHAKTSVVNTPAVLFARSNKGIDYDALDGEPVYIFFMIAASEDAHDLHIDTLAKLSKMLLNDDFTQGLKTCGTPDEVYTLVDKYSEKPQETINKEVKENVVNTVGAGDSVVAGFVNYMLKHNEVEKAFRFAVACGTATSFSEDIGELNFIEEIYNKLVIERKCYGN